MLVDLHCHTHFSLCGCHSLLEVLHQAQQKGIQVQAITDHGPTLGGHIPTTFFDRFKIDLPNFTLLKGMECNLLGEGKIDVITKYLPYMDIVLLGLHPNTPRHQGIDFYTKEMLAAIEQNPCIDVLTHLNTPCYPVDFKTVIAAAQQKGIAIELNNSKTNLQRSPDSLTEELIKACLAAKAKVVINTDAHCLNEIADDRAIQKLLAKYPLPPEQIITHHPQQTLKFIAERRIFKQTAGRPENSCQQ